MEYITVQEAAEKWGISVRQVQNLCGKGKISGAIRFNRSWAIPTDVKKPKDGRCKANEQRQNNIVQSFQSMCGNEEMLAKIVEFFPYPIHVYTPDGTLILTNEACLKIFHITSKDKLIGKLNVLQDTDIEKWGVKEHVLRAFQGETIQLYDMKAPISDIVKKYGKRESGYESIFQNIVAFPIYNDHNQLVYVVIVFITSKLYRGKEEIIKGKEYIEGHWLEEFDIDEVAGYANLSRYHFARLFKKHTGMTPYCYYQDIKINKLKEKLCDKNLSISQVFANCGMDYNGNFAKLFKEKVGMTPSQYQVSATKE